MESNNEFVIQIESQIRNNVFKNKEELMHYLTSLMKRELISQEEDVKKLLNLYDSMHVHEQPLNMDDYKGANLGEQNFIISTKEDRILKTNESAREMDEEFKKTQNEMLVTNKVGIVNADDVFKKMADTEKEELNLISLTEALSIDNVSLETLQKIRYFINNKYINPYEYKIDITTNIFYNVNTKEVFEVRKNEEKNEYELYKGGEVIYRENEQEEVQEQELEYQSEEEKQLYENKEKENVKKRVLVPPKNYPNNRAFSKMSFLILNIITFITLITMIYLLNK